MSSRRTHTVVGAVAGGTYALVCAPKNQKPLNNLAEVVGGALGGVVGSRLPDVLEPAIHSFHRSTFHSVATAGTITYGMAQKQVSPADALRKLADEAAQRAAILKANGQPALQDELLELLLHVAAGVVSGLPAGYVSHLACDMTTPRSIPLFTRGF
jgi:membrane-bound metal-dependent hydrolase YbcI (DUF457 family)